MYGKFILNADLLALAAALGERYDARVISWGRDEKGNEEVGGHPNSWHLWKRGANAVDMKPQDPKMLPMMADDARNAGYQVKCYARSLHIEVPW